MYLHDDDWAPDGAWGAEEYASFRASQKEAMDDYAARKAAAQYLLPAAVKAAVKSPLAWARQATHRALMAERWMGVRDARGVRPVMEAALYFRNGRVEGEVQAWNFRLPRRRVVAKNAAAFFEAVGRIAASLRMEAEGRLASEPRVGCATPSGWAPDGVEGFVGSLVEDVPEVREAIAAALMAAPVHVEM